MCQNCLGTRKTISKHFLLAQMLLLLCYIRQIIFIVVVIDNLSFMFTNGVGLHTKYTEVLQHNFSIHKTKEINGFDEISL